MKIRTNPDQHWSGPEFRTKIRTTLPDQVGPVRNSGPTYRTKICWSGIPDLRTGPKNVGPEIRTSGPDQFKSVRNSGPPDRTKNKIGPEIRTNPDRPGPRYFWSGAGIHANNRIVTMDFKCTPLRVSSSSSSILLFTSKLIVARLTQS